jgi:endo-1,4-beta-D-glucanase Y
MVFSTAVNKKKIFLKCWEFDNCNLAIVKLDN